MFDVIARFFLTPVGDRRVRRLIHTFEGKEVLKVEPSALEAVAREAMREGGIDLAQQGAAQAPIAPEAAAAAEHPDVTVDYMHIDAAMIHILAERFRITQAKAAELGN